MFLYLNRRPGSPSQQGNRLPASYQSLQDPNHHRRQLEHHHHHHAPPPPHLDHRSALTTPKSETKRAFDVSSLIGDKSSTPSPPPPVVSGASSLYPSPNVSVGPPPPPPPPPHPPHPGLYPYLLHSGLYQHLAAAAAGVIPHPGSLNPMLLNAQLALNPLLASAYAAANLNNLSASDRLRAPPPGAPPVSRYSPYPSPSSPRTHSTSPPHSSSSGSAFHPIAPKTKSCSSSSSPPPAMTSPTILSAASLLASTATENVDRKSTSPAPKSPKPLVSSSSCPGSPNNNEEMLPKSNGKVTPNSVSTPSLTNADNNKDLKGMEKLVKELNGDIKT